MNFVGTEVSRTVEVLRPGKWFLLGGYLWENVCKCDFSQGRLALVFSGMHPSCRWLLSFYLVFLFLYMQSLWADLSPRKDYKFWIV